jgi:membrane protease YdiL (CAAX protease family)
MDESPEPQSKPRADPAFAALVFETLAFLLATCAYRLIYFGLRPPTDRATITSTMLLATLVEDVGTSMLVLFLLKRNLRELLVPAGRREWIREVAWGVALAGGIWVVDRWSPGLARFLGLRAGGPSWGPALRDRGVLATFLLATPISCLRQELQFRLYFQSRFARILGNKRDLGVFLASWLFAAVHGYSPAATLGVFFVGLLLGSAFAISGRLPRVVIAHIITNVLAALRLG